MRIIAGRAGGRRLKTLPGNNTRPTADRVKEAVFSALTPYLAESRVLDAFAGSAALGLEALSRGASAAWFCERDERACRVCAANIAACGLPGARLLRGDVLAVLPRLRERERELRFDLIFLDPPYRCDLLRPCLELIAAGEWLEQDGIVIAESAAALPQAEHPAFKVIREKKYGDTLVRFYKFAEQDKSEEDK